MTSPENEIKDTSSAAVMWWLTILLGFISPLIFFLTKKDDAYVQANCKESLNIQLNLTFLYFLPPSPLRRLLFNELCDRIRLNEMASSFANEPGSSRADGMIKPERINVSDAL